jgi:hypothetical protein
MSLRQENILEAYSALSSLDLSDDYDILSTELHDLSDTLGVLSTSYDNFISNESFKTLADIDETIGYFLHEDNEAIEVSIKIAEAQSTINVTADYLYHIEMFSNPPEASSLSELRDALLEIVSVIAKYLKKLTSLRAQDFYYSVISYSSDLPSACPMSCLSTADKNLHDSLSSTLEMCMSFLSKDNQFQPSI